MISKIFYIYGKKKHIPVHACIFPFVYTVDFNFKNTATGIWRRCIYCMVVCVVLLRFIKISEVLMWFSINQNIFLIL